MSKQSARIEDWQVIGDYLWGRVVGHPRQHEFTSGYQKTSRIVRKTSTHVETENTIYTLGKPYQQSYQQQQEEDCCSVPADNSLDFVADLAIAAAFSSSSQEDFSSFSGGGGDGGGAGASGDWSSDD